MRAFPASLLSAGLGSFAILFALGQLLALGTRSRIYLTYWNPLSPTYWNPRPLTSQVEPMLHVSSLYMCLLYVLNALYVDVLNYYT